MKERPILFSAPMVLAILAGKKTQTRRIVKPQPEAVGYGRSCEVHPYMTGTQWPLAYYEMRGACWNSSQPLKCRYGQPGDRLWVKENWAARLDQDHLKPSQLPRTSVGYWADGPGKCCNTGCAGAAGRVRSSMFMPRWASRITLEITNVRVERVQEITEEDAKAEGVEPWPEADLRPDGELRDGPSVAYRAGFHDIWNGINGNWDANPWVFVIEFRRVD